MNKLKAFMFIKNVIRNLGILISSSGKKAISWIVFRKLQRYWKPKLSPDCRASETVKLEASTAVALFENLSTLFSESVFSKTLNTHNKGLTAVWVN